MAKARASAGLDTHQMAKILEVSERTVRNWEADRTHPPKAVRVAYHWETRVPLQWIEGGGPEDVSAHVTQRYERNNVVRLKLAAA